MTTGLTFHWTAWTAALSATMVVAAAALGFRAWRRSGFAAHTAMLEALRLVVVVLIAATLNQPEWLAPDGRDAQPALVILRDDSGSMQTRDIVEPHEPVPGTRAEKAGELARGAAWNSVRQRLDVIVQGFSPHQDTPGDGTDLHGALMDCLTRHADLRAIVLLSDGDWNVGDAPARAALQLRTRNVPVYAVAVGSASRMRDIELVRVDAPAYGVVGKPLQIPFSIESGLPESCHSTVTLTTPTGDEVTKDVTVPGMGRLDDTILWKPVATGDVGLTLKVSAHEDELFAENNQRIVSIAVREEDLRVLLVESVPRWEYRYLRNALERDPGVEVFCLLFHPELAQVGGGKGYLRSFPATMEELSRYDVLFLGDVGVDDGQLSLDQCRAIRRVVEGQAAGLVLMPGSRGLQAAFANTELDALYPVVLDPSHPRGFGAQAAGRFQLTSAGRNSLLTRLEDDQDENAAVWESLPGFHWHAPVARVKSGVDVLAVRKAETSPSARPVPLLVTRPQGTGKVLFMGTDAAWRWRKGVEDKVHYRFWGQVVRWMAYQRGLAEGKSMRLFYSPDRPQAGATMVLNANVMDDRGEPLQQGLVAVGAVAPSGSVEHVRLAAVGGEWGLFSSSFTPRESGQYGLTLSSDQTNATLETALHVESARRERQGRPVRFDVLREIAELTRGRAVSWTDAQALIGDLAELPRREPSLFRIRLWCHPIWVGLIVLLLTVLWAGRRMTGAV